MPGQEGNRYEKDVVVTIFAGGVGWADPVSRLKYVGPVLTARITAAMQFQQEPSLVEVVQHIVDQTAQMVTTNPAFQGARGARKAVESLVSQMTLSPRALMCTNSYRIRLVNRFGFNVLVDLLQYAKDFPPPTLPAASLANLLNVVPSHLRRDVICGFNEGSYTAGAPNASGMLAPANSPFLCAVNARTTNKASAFGKRLRQCPCLSPQRAPHPQSASGCSLSNRV